VSNDPVSSPPRPPEAPSSGALLIVLPRIENEAVCSIMSLCLLF
jgi:hypothetical protein